MTGRVHKLQAVDMTTGIPLPIGEPRWVEEDMPVAIDPVLPAEPPPDDVPYPGDSTIPSVLEWVNDPTATDAIRSDRAKAAIAAEHGRGKPRTTLLTELSERIGRP